MKKIAITGLSGVIGSVLIEDLSDNFDIINLYHESKYGAKKNVKNVKLNLLKKTSIFDTLTKINPDVIIHMASITHIDRCERNKKFGKNGFVWKINVEATREIIKYSEKNKTHLIYLSTECVFKGNMKIYSEISKKNPKNWYGYTKSKAEDYIINSKAHYAIIRSVVAYHKNDNGKTIYGKIEKKLKTNQKFYAASDILFTPTHTPDIAKAIKLVIIKKQTGILHIAPANSLTPYDFALMIANSLNITKNLVIKTSLNKIFNERKANLRLKNSCLEGKKTNKLLNFTPSRPEEII